MTKRTRTRITQRRHRKTQRRHRKTQRRHRKTQRRHRKTQRTQIKKALPNQVTVFQNYVPKKEIIMDANHESDGNMIPGMRHLLEKIHLLK
jgi:hypothetical protein